MLEVVKGISNAVAYHFHPVLGMLISAGWSRFADAEIHVEVMDGPEPCEVKYVYKGVERGSNIEETRKQLPISREDIDKIMLAKTVKLSYFDIVQNEFSVVHDLFTTARNQIYGTPANEKLFPLYSWKGDGKLMGINNMVPVCYPEALNLGTTFMQPSNNATTHENGPIRPFMQYVMLDDGIIHGPGVASLELKDVGNVMHRERPEHIYQDNEITEGYHVFQLVTGKEKQEIKVIDVNLPMYSYYFGYEGRKIGVDLFQNITAYSNKVRARTVLGAYYTCALLDAVKRISKSLPDNDDGNAYDKNKRTAKLFAELFTSPTVETDFFSKIVDVLPVGDTIQLSLDTNTNTLYNDACENMYSVIQSSDILGPKLTMLKSLFITCPADKNEMIDEEIGVSTWDRKGMAVYSYRPEVSSSALICIAVAAAFDELLSKETDGDGPACPDFYSKIMCLIGAAQIPNCVDFVNNDRATLKSNLDLNVSRKLVDGQYIVSESTAEEFFT